MKTGQVKIIKRPGDICLVFYCPGGLDSCSWSRNGTMVIHLAQGLICSEMLFCSARVIV